MPALELPQSLIELPITPRLPLVTVICLCYNQERFVEEALQSVIQQTYPNIQLIIVDDGSTDGSKVKIKAFLEQHPKALFLNLAANQGMCRAFNTGLQQAQGEFIIDLAADDILLPNRVERQVSVFSQLDNTYGVIFTDAAIIDETGHLKGSFYSQKKLSFVPSGNIYQNVLEKHFICSPTMMSRRRVYEELGGYDESLCYEDFDFWVRSSRHYQYYFMDEILTYKRQVSNSDSTKWYRRGYNPHLASTLKVLEKAFTLNRTKAENRSLANSVRYHLRQAYFTENFRLVEQYAQLLDKISPFIVSDYFFLTLSKYQISFFWLYKWYLKKRFGQII